MLSEDVSSLASPEDRFESDWLPSNNNNHSNAVAAAAASEPDYGQELVSKGPPKAEVQLRFVNFTDLQII